MNTVFNVITFLTAILNFSRHCLPENRYLRGIEINRGNNLEWLFHEKKSQLSLICHWGEVVSTFMFPRGIFLKFENKKVLVLLAVKTPSLHLYKDIVKGVNNSPIPNV